jgi:hypothetical protein
MTEEKQELDLRARAELARLAYGEQIIRCTERDPEEMEGLLAMDGEVEKARWWRAFAVAKREGNADYIRGLLAYLISHNLGQLDRKKQKHLIRRIEQGKVNMKDLTCEELAGTCLRWKHIFKLVGKEFNPTREKEFVKGIYERLRREEECLSNP